MQLRSLILNTMQKKYVTEYELVVEVGGTIVHFTGIKGNSIFTTSDTKLQKEMESHRDYGVKWRLEDITLEGVYHEEEKGTRPDPDILSKALKENAKLISKKKK